MIGSFWNLCRACPSMPVDKLHSEYRSTYRWHGHEYTGNSRPEVVRRPPVPNQFVAANEPPLPRRKKCPELAYRTHEFIGGSDGPIPNLRSDSNTRARSDERTGLPSRRSKSEGPPGIANGKAYPTNNKINDEVTGGKASGKVQAGESSGLFKKTISKLSTEYRLQFVWPNVHRAVRGAQQSVNADGVDVPKKSHSMGAIKSSQMNAIPTVHKKRTAHEKEATVYELEPLVNDADERKPNEKPAGIHSTQPKHSSARPMSQLAEHERLNQFLTRRENYGFEQKQTTREKATLAAKDGVDVTDNKNLIANGVGPYGDHWYRDVIELRKKAGEYKCRGWGVEIDPELYKKQRDLWEQVSRRSSLSALSLASSIHRPITKEEKDEENNKKTSPTKHSRGRSAVPGHAHQIDNKTIADGPLLPARVQTIRHHLERTTGPDVEEGALLPSPTREKLMPTIPKSKDSDALNSQRGSPKKSIPSRHGSPQKGSPQKCSPKKVVKGRSQSVGPTVIENNESPKRQARSVSTAPTAASTAKVQIKKTPVSTPTISTAGTGVSAGKTERRPRPSTLSTSIHSRSKSSSLGPSGRAQSAPGNHHLLTSHDQTNNQIKKSANVAENVRNKSKQASSKQISTRPKTTNGQTAHSTGSTVLAGSGQTITKEGQDNKMAEMNDEQHDATCSPQTAPEIEHIVKSPPEPTRVKSPEQIIMRSPDPVNWTVPLDTGKTFTVTQNVKEGEAFSRPQSEVKVSTPIERPPPAPLSAPPELAQQAKIEAWNEKYTNDSEDKDNASGIKTASSSASPAKTIVVPEVRYDKLIAGSTLRCLEDPSFEIETTNSTIGAGTSTASDVLEKARDRFDRFWGGNKEENV